MKTNKVFALVVVSNYDYEIHEVVGVFDNYDDIRFASLKLESVMDEEFRCIIEQFDIINGVDYTKVKHFLKESE